VRLGPASPSPRSVGQAVRCPLLLLPYPMPSRRHRLNACRRVSTPSSRRSSPGALHKAPAMSRELLLFASCPLSQAPEPTAILANYSPRKRLTARPPPPADCCVLAQRAEALVGPHRIAFARITVQPPAENPPSHHERPRSW